MHRIKKKIKTGRLICKFFSNPRKKERKNITPTKISRCFASSEETLVGSWGFGRVAYAIRRIVGDA